MENERRIASSFARAGLIDEYWIHLNPSAIDEGRLLLNDRLNMKLLDVRPFDSGVVVLHYARLERLPRGPHRIL